MELKEFFDVTGFLGGQLSREVNLKAFTQTHYQFLLGGIFSNDKFLSRKLFEGMIILIVRRMVEAWALDPKRAGDLGKNLDLLIQCFGDNPHLEDAFDEVCKGDEAIVPFPLTSCRMVCEGLETLWS